MALTRKKLAFLRLASTNGDIYDPPASTKGLVHNIIIHNTHAANPQVVVINLHDGSNEWELYSMTLAIDETVQLDYPGEGWLIDAASKITGSSTDANVTVVNISGTEET
jgi:hypothetical protein